MTIQKDMAVGKSLTVFHHASFQIERQFESRITSKHSEISQRIDRFTIGYGGGNLLAQLLNLPEDPWMKSRDAGLGKGRIQEFSPSPVKSWIAGCSE